MLTAAVQGYAGDTVDISAGVHTMIVVGQHLYPDLRTSRKQRHQNFVGAAFDHPGARDCDDSG